MEVQLADGRIIPVESHRIKIVQPTKFLPINERLTAIRNAGFNTFLLQNHDIFQYWEK